MSKEEVEINYKYPENVFVIYGLNGLSRENNWLKTKNWEKNLEVFLTVENREQYVPWANSKKVLLIY